MIKLEQSHINSPIIDFFLVSTKFHYFKIVPPASPYIIIPPGGIIIYELAGGNI